MRARLMDYNLLNEVVENMERQGEDDFIVRRDISIVRRGQQLFRQVKRQNPPFYINDHRFGYVVKGNLHARGMTFYADKLCVTTRYLGTVIHQESGTTGKEWTDKAVIAAAKVMLRHDDKPVARIAEELNFPNVSFFCKYFKRLTGITPQQFRNE